MSMAVVLDALKKFEALQEVELCMLTRKNGEIVASVGNVGSISLETFGIMTATIYGAGNTANEHLNKEKPNRIVMRANDGDTVIKKIDSQHILVMRTHKRDNFAKVLANMDETVDYLLENWNGVRF